MLEFYKAVIALAGYSTDPSPFLDKALEFDPKFILPHVFKVNRQHCEHSFVVVYPYSAVSQGCSMLTGGGLPSDEKGTQ